MTSREIRSSFLDYFRRQGHTIVSSSSLVPGDDPTLLFTNAGMNQFKDTFLGREKRAYTRATTSQKCMRVSGKHNDLDNVGPSLRHHTFFEMLGNFSFGDYFKKEAIPFAWELLTKGWNLPADRMYPTIFKGEGGIARDADAYDIWAKLVPAERITELGSAENFWSMGETGPCGRCSEIHYFRGNQVPCSEELEGRQCLGIDCSCDRFVEIWNNVFMEFDRQADGTLNPLPAPSIDTGMGLERITSVIQGKIATYDTDAFTPILNAIGERARRTYGASLADPSDVSMRVIADHLRAMTFLIADGVLPSNEFRGYVLRKIMRRAMLHGKKLGFSEPVLYTFVDVIVNEMGSAYPELRVERDVILQRVKSEEERFETVLTSGLPRLEEALDRAASGNRVLPGDEAFRLYDSFGVPLDFMEDLAEQRQLTVDREGFDRAMEGQREKARAGSAFKGGDKALALTLSPALEKTLDELGDQFAGYETTTVPGTPIVALFDENGAPIESVSTGAKAYVALARTPFYIESGGQVSDAGSLLGADGSVATVEQLVRPRPSRPRLHLVRVENGTFRTGQLVTAEVKDDVRDATRRNHTATHLLHAALRTVLGTHVKQAGSLVAPDRLRFDFVHSSAISADELRRIEHIVNDQIVRNTAVATDITTPEEAIAQGAMALFGEKYGDRVRVVSIPGFSLELCGGTHVRTTGDIGLFAITEESGVAAGVRRIEAVTGAGAVRWVQTQRDALHSLVAALNTTPAHGVETVQKLLADNKRLAREVERLKIAGARNISFDIPAGTPTLRMDGQSPTASTVPTSASAVVDVEGVQLLRHRSEGLEKSSLRSVADSLRDRLGSGVVVIASQNDDRVALVVSVSKDLTTRVQAGRLVKELAPIVGGGGGGRPDFAEAGGKNPAKIAELLEQAPAVLKSLLAGT